MVRACRASRLMASPDAWINCGDYGPCPSGRSNPSARWTRSGAARDAAEWRRQGPQPEEYGVDLVEQVRGAVVRQSLAGTSFARDWPLRRRAILGYLGSAGELESERVIGVGDRLSQVFVDQTRAVAHDRDQSSVSGGGVVWDTLVNLYLNMCFAGTDVVVLRAKQIPSSVRRAFRVRYRTATIDAGIDHVALVLPGGKSQPAEPTAAKALSRFADAVAAGFDEVTAVVLACKTNWNDNVQTPMLWSLLYRLRASGAQPPTDVSVGDPPFSLERMVDFDFAFITVPSNRVDRFHARSMPVLRGETMSGGVFWGRPSKPGVARSLSEFCDYQGGMRERFPGAELGGVGFAAEARSRRGAVDLEAFDLY